FALAALLAVMVARTPYAQVLFGSIVGTVTDPSGAAVPQATVKVTNQDTNETREVATNEAGGFVLSTLPAGTYSVAISKTGFKTFTAQGTPLSLNTVVRVDTVLQVG